MTLDEANEYWRAGHVDTVTPVVALDNGVLMKREDAFGYGTVNGGKARAALEFCMRRQGTVAGVVTSGSRASMSSEILGEACRVAGLKAVYHTSAGAETREMARAAVAGVDIRTWRCGYMSLVKCRAKEDAGARGMAYLPFGFECQEMVDAVAPQARALPWGSFERIIICVGSGMNLAAVLVGMLQAGQYVPVKGIMVGGRSVVSRLDLWAPKEWPSWVHLEHCGRDYTSDADDIYRSYHGIALDPRYEAKVVPYLRPGDLFWIIGKRP